MVHLRDAYETWRKPVWAWGRRPRPWTLPEAHWRLRGRRDIPRALAALGEHSGNCGLLLDDLGAALSYLQPLIDSPQSCFRESLRILGEVGDEAELARTLRAWARYELTKGDEEKGKAMWREARDTFARLDLPLEVARMERHG